MPDVSVILPAGDIATVAEQYLPPDQGRMHERLRLRQPEVRQRYLADPTLRPLEFFIARASTPSASESHRPRLWLLRGDGDGGQREWHQQPAPLLVAGAGRAES